MITPAEWLKHFDSKSCHPTRDHQYIDLIDRIQKDALSVNKNGMVPLVRCAELLEENRILKDAQPKWVTGEEAKGWPEGCCALRQNSKSGHVELIQYLKPEFIGMEIRSIGHRFLRLDDLLNQEWPK